MKEKYNFIKHHPFLKLGKAPAKRDKRNIKLAAVLYKAPPPVPPSGTSILILQRGQYQLRSSQTTGSGIAL